MDYTATEREIAGRTARAAGAVSAKALVPKAVLSRMRKGDTVLNYGAGKVNAEGRIPHADMLTEAGGRVFSYDFYHTSPMHDEHALRYRYAIVMASNVLNVAQSQEMLESALRELARATTANGCAVFNYPASPRKSGVDATQVLELAQRHFAHVQRIGGTKQAPVFEARK